MRIFNLSTSLILIILFNLLVCPLVWSDKAPAGEDAIDEDDEDAVINDESPTTNEDVQTAAEADTEEEGEEKITSSPFVTTNLLFTQPESLEFPAGKLVKLIVGFHNNGSSNFTVDSIEASLRYPQDVSYVIQNFTAFDYSKVIDASKEATFEYAFTPSETFSSRPFNLIISLSYKDHEGKAYINGLFNDTINVVEPSEGLDGETFFLYIFLLAIVVLLLVLAQQFFSVFSKKHRITKSQNGNKISNGNGVSEGEVDMEWIPKEHLQQNKSPRVSPRQRKPVKQASGSEE